MPAPESDVAERATRPDVQAAITVIVRRGPRSNADIDLTRANLTLVDLTNRDLRGLNLTGVNLTDAHLLLANLTRANLTGVNLTGAHLTGAHPHRRVLSSGPENSGGVGA